MAILETGHEIRDGGIPLEDAIDGRLVRAYERALSFLSFRPRSRAEVRRNLKQHGVEPTVIEEVIEHLEARGFLGDREFALFWARNREQYSPRGVRMMRQELFQKGLDRETVEEALETLELDEAELALAAARKKARSYTRLSEEQFATRMMAHLQRRGFSFSVARQACGLIWSETG